MLWLNLLLDIFRRLGKRISHFGRNSGIHGFKHIFQEDRSLISRIFWSLVVLLSLGCLYLLLILVVHRGGEVSFTPDTRYLHWTTKFPAVTVCENYNQKLVQKRFTELYPKLMESLNFDYRRYLTDLIYGRGTCTRVVCVPCGEKIACDMPWRDIIYKIHKNCEELLNDCYFNNEQFPCCKHFHIVDSEYGPCYSFNTLQSRYNDDSALFTVNMTTGPGLLNFRLLYDSQISVHSQEELSTNILDPKLKTVVKVSAQNYFEFLFSMVEVENDPQLRFEDINLRKCRHLNEVPKNSFHTYPVYSHGACQLAEETESSFKHCQCISSVRDESYEAVYCNYTGLNCLVTLEAQKIKLGLDVHTDHYDCLPSCLESELKMVHIFRRWSPEDHEQGTSVNMRMVSLPTMRYQKHLLHTNLDLVVTVGGMAGLFFSASILSLVEIVYLMFITPDKE